MGMENPQADHERGHGPILFWILTGAVAVIAVFMFLPFVSAVLWAAVLSVLLWPLFNKLRSRFSKTFSALMATLVTGVVIVIPFVGLGTVVGIQVYDFANKLVAERKPGESRVTVEQIADQLDRLARPVLNQVGLQDIDVKDYIDTHRSDLTQMIRGPLTMGISKLVMTSVMLVIALLTMFFMLKDGQNMLGPVCDLIPLPRDETIKILEKMRGTIQAVFVGVVLVSLIQGAIATVLYTVTGVPSPLLWGVVTVVFCTIPLLGSPVIYVPLAIQLFLTGKVAQGIILLAGGFFVVSTVDNFLRPFFIGARSDLHPMAIFFSLLGGVLLLGPIGIMAGPVVLTLLFGLTDVLRARRMIGDDATPTVTG